MAEPWPRDVGRQKREPKHNWEELRPTFSLAAKRIRAIDLSCVRACGAGAGAKTSNSELNFPVGEPSALLPQPPISLVV